MLLTLAALRLVASLPLLPSPPLPATPSPPGVVDVAGGCPGAAAVAARLAGSPMVEGGRRVQVAREGAWLQVRLLGAGGELLAERRLPGRSSCEDLADAVAVVVSTWALTLRPREGRAPPEIRLAEPPRPPPPPPPLLWEVALAGALSIGGRGELAGGGLLGFALGPRRLPLQGVVSFYGASRRLLPVAEGGAAWTRLAPGLGLRWQPLSGSLRLSLRGECLLGALLVSGQGFPEVYEGSAFDVGVLGGARLGGALGRGFVGFVDLALLGWLVPQGLRVLGQGAVAEVPRVEVLLSAGLALGR